ncbi:sulfatase-like hydrolase/transferase, partial [bacterium]|nr:sulfatase-like hydrolase/transferase [bacterium]
PWLRKYTGDNIPFFLWIHYFDPHSPYAPPERERIYYQNKIVSGLSEWPDNFAAENARKALMFTKSEVVPGRPEEMYLGEVSEIDRALGVVLHQMVVSEAMKNTLVAVLADHGESFGEHGYFYTHGEDVYEPALAIPLILYSGNSRVTTRLDNRLASAVDIATTVLPHVGLDTPGQMEGFDLLAPEKRQTALIENFGIIMNKRALKQRGIRTGKWKFINYPDKDYRSLYNLEADPGERQNIQSSQNKFCDLLGNQVKDGFQATSQRRKLSMEDLSPETLDKLKSLGYIVP